MSGLCDRCVHCGAFKWISIKDRLPSNGEEVACAFDKDKDIIFMVRCNNGKWEEQHEDDWGYQWVELESPVTHWMPIMDKPEGFA